MAAGIVFRVRIDGARAVLRAFNELPRDATVALKDGTGELVDKLIPRVKSAGFAEGRQAARVARSVRRFRGRLPSIAAGGGGKAGALVYGSEYGARRRFGWYAHPRYRNSTGRQFKPWIQGSYWFRDTIIEDNAGTIEAKWLEIADDIAQDWAT